MEQLFLATGRDAKKFEALVKQLDGFVAAVDAAGLVVSRFFATTNYSEEECGQVLDLLLTSKEPLTAFADIKDSDVRDIFVDNEGNMDGQCAGGECCGCGWRLGQWEVFGEGPLAPTPTRTPHGGARLGARNKRPLPPTALPPLTHPPAWRSARKAVAALSLTPEVKTVLTDLAAAGRLDLAKTVAFKAAQLKAVISKTLDAEVRSAVALTKEQQAAVAKALPQYTTPGQTIDTKFVVDPAVLGGLLVTMKNTTIDLTVTTKLVEVMAATSRAGKQLA